MPRHSIPISKHLVSDFIFWTEICTRAKLGHSLADCSRGAGTCLPPFSSSLQLLDSSPLFTTRLCPVVNVQLPWT